MYDINSIEINYWAVLVAGISSMVIGYAWYSTSLFGRMWMAAIGKTEEEIKAGYKPATMLWTYLVAVVVAYVLNHFIQLVGAQSLTEALLTAFWAWLGFIFTVIVTNAFYEGRSAKLVWINSFYQLAMVLAMAAILYSWR